MFYSKPGRISNSNAISILNKRIQWLMTKTAEREAAGQVAELYRAEIKANELAILAIEDRKRYNISTNGGGNDEMG